MADRHCHLHEVLDGYAKFLQQENLAMNTSRTSCAHMREFLLFALAAFRIQLRADAGPVSGRSGRARGWQYVFPAGKVAIDPADG